MSKSRQHAAGTCELQLPFRLAHTALNRRCRTALEIYQWGEIPPKPDDRTLPEKIEGQEKGFQNRMCCNIDACSITDFQACRAQVRTRAFPVSCSISSFAGCTT